MAPVYWLDTDPGVDDALAILSAIRDVGPDLVGFSTVQGNFAEAVSARNLSRILGAATSGSLTSPDWSPLIARGSRRSLVGPGYRADDFVGSGYHGRDGLGDVSWQPADFWRPEARTCAAQEIVNASNNTSDLHLVCIGPLTNLAIAVCLDPELPARINSLVVMGGSLRAGGNETMAAEYNFIADPEAARVVLNAGFRNLLLIPLDGCADVVLGKNEQLQLELLGSTAARLALDLTRGWQDRISAGRGVPIYDVVAWLLGRHPALGRWERIYVTVDTGHDVGRGASIADWQGRSGNEPNARVALEVPDPIAFFDKWYQLLG